MHLLINYIHGGGGRETLPLRHAANQILDGLGTVGTKHAILDQLRLNSPSYSSLNCNPLLLSIIVASGSASLSLLSSLVYCSSKSLLLSMLFALHTLQLLGEKSSEMASVFC